MTTITQRLADIASQLEASSLKAPTWQDQCAANRFWMRSAAHLVHYAIRKGLICDAQPLLVANKIADPSDGQIDWRELRSLLNIEHLQWLDEFDQNHPQKFNISFEWDDDDKFKSEDVPIHYTDDQLKKWYREQSLAWFAVLSTAAEASRQKDQLACDSVTDTSRQVLPEVTGDDDPTKPDSPPVEMRTKQMSQAKAALRYFRKVDWSQDHKERVFRQMVKSGEVWSEQVNPPDGRLFIFDCRVIK